MTATREQARTGFFFFSTEKALPIKAEEWKEKRERKKEKANVHQLAAKKKEVLM